MMSVIASFFAAAFILGTGSHHVCEAKSIAHVLLIDDICGTQPGDLVKYFVADMERKKSIPDYPVNITVEVFDKCNSSMYRDFIQARVSNSTMVPLSLIIGPRYEGIHHFSIIGSSQGIPVLTANAPSSFELPQWMPTTFFTLPPTAQGSSSFINAFHEAGAKTIVGVAVIETVTTINEDICLLGTLDYARSRGYTLLGSFNFTRASATLDGIRGLVRKIRDELKPDVLMWCDVLAAGQFIKSNVLPVLKSENYLPKALMVFGVLSTLNPASNVLRDEGLLLYSTDITLWSPRLKGSDYTQEDNPYSNYFFPNVSVKSTVDYFNTGALPDRPSSNELFVEWFSAIFGFPPTLISASTYSQFDMAESALYRAAKYRDADISIIPNRSHLAGSEVMAMLITSSQRGMFGPMRYNKFRVNDAAPSITLQDLSTSGFPDIVSPKSTQTKTLVYPMPTWDERVYEWKLLKNSTDRASLIVATVCAAILIALAITAILYRGEVGVRMLDYRHIVLMCLASALACFGLALFWQGDVNQSQCDTYLWVVHLPLSFVIQLSNMKAHRLSVFLRLNGTPTKRPFTHAKVMGYTLLWLLLTVAALLVITYVDPPKATRFIEDPLRPKFDHYECKMGSVGVGFLYGLVAVHFSVSLATTIAVRNGSQAFRDGTVLKEAFILFYICIAFPNIIDKINVSNETNFFIRTVFIAMGITLLNLRLLFQRCVCQWIPKSARAFVALHLVQPLIKYTEKFLPGRSASVFASSERLLDEDCVYAIDIPADNHLDDLYKVFRNPARLAIFSAIADKLLISENLEFIAEVLAYKRMNTHALKESTSSASAAIRQRAKHMFEKYGRAGADFEINISHALNRNLEKSLADWDESASFLSSEAAEEALDKDLLMRNKVFDAALKEIATMLYQNMWNKFIEKETELQMGADYNTKSVKAITAL